MSKKFFLEEQIEKTLWWSRFIVLIPVLISLLMFIILILWITIKIYHLVINFLCNWFSEILLAWIISIIDVSLLAVIILIFAWWIYELFIDEIDIDKNHKTKAKILMIKNIDELKEKIWKVIIILLIVWLFKQMLLQEPKNQLDMLYISIIILIMAISLKVISIKK
jgi:uncharacterized membrane protein YqhA